MGKAFLYLKVICNWVTLHKNLYKWIILDKVGDSNLIENEVKTNMVYALSVGKAIPQYEISQDTTVEFAKEIFHDSFKDLERLLPVFKNGEIEKDNLQNLLNGISKHIHLKKRMNCILIEP